MEERKNDTEIERMSDSQVNDKVLDSIMYSALFSRKLPLHMIFFTKNGFWLLSLYLYMFYVSGMSFMKATGLLLFVVFVVSLYFYHYKFHQKNSITFFAIKGDVMSKFNKARRRRKRNPFMEKKF